MTQVMRGQTMPGMVKMTYAKPFLDQMIFQRALDLEAQRLGLRVTPDEETDRIKQIPPGSLGWRHLAEGPLPKRSPDAHGYDGRAF
jgi:hypothetical protein